MLNDLLYLSSTTPGEYTKSLGVLAGVSTPRTNQIGYVLATGSTTGEIYVDIINETINLYLTNIERNTLEGNGNYSAPPVVSPSPIGNWNMYTVTHSFSSRQVTLYVNGILYGGPFTFVNDRGDTPGPLEMGYTSNNAQYAFLNGFCGHFFICLSWL